MRKDSSLNKQPSLWHVIKNNHWAQGLLLASASVILLVCYVVIGHRVIAPINVLPGCCEWSSTSISWTADHGISSDITDYILPGRFFTAEAFSRGVFPLWNPLFFGGEGYFSNSQSALLHPINILYWLTNPLNVQTASVIASVFLLVLCSYVMLRRYRMSAFTAAVGSLLYLGTPWVIFWSQWGTIVWIMAIWPLVVVLLESWRGDRYRLLKFPPILSILIGVQFYFGHLQFSLLTFVIVGVWIVAYGVLDKQARSNIIRGGSIIVVLGSMIAMLAILPAFDQAQRGHRDSVLPLNTYEAITRDVKTLFSFIPYSVGPDYYMEYSPPSPNVRQMELSRFLVALGIMVVCIRLLRHRLGFVKHVPKEIVFLAALLIVGLLAGWAIFPFNWIIAHSPLRGISMKYFAALAVFAAPMIAAWVLNYILKQSSRYKHRISNQLPILIGLAVFVVAMIGSSNYWQYRSTTMIGWAMVTLTVLIIISRQAKNVTDYILKLCLTVLLLIHPFLFYYATVPMPEKHLYHVGNPVYQCILDDARSRNVSHARAISYLSPNTNLYYGIDVMNGYDSLFAKDTAQFIKAYNYPKQETNNQNILAVNAPYITNYSKAATANALGVNYLIVPVHTLVSDTYEQICLDAGQKSSIYRTKDKQELVYFATKTQQKSLNEQLDAIAQDALYPGLVLQDTIQSADYSKATVHNYSIRYNTITAQVSAPNEQLLFVAQSNNPNWRAYIDGSPVKIITANYKFMAIQVPAGTHTIQLDYAPSSVTVGAFASVAGLAVAVGLGSIDYRRRKHTTTH